MNSILTVTQINCYLKSIIDSDSNLKNIYVTGEISNFTNHYRSGHFYFTLKDDSCSMKAVMFSRYSQSIAFRPYDGLKVIVRASVSVFERDGVYQLYVTDMMPEGVGELTLAFEQLKGKLEREGLFAPEKKKAIPQFPQKIAVITSPTGAALQDIINVISRRYPCCELTVYPVHVQGELSAPEIVAAIGKADKCSENDVIILGRGGGSIEDLWSFNEEIVARAIFKCETPLISAVGHETDFTISDLVSDLRAPTPSAAAEIATPDRFALIASLENYKNEMSQLMEGKLFDCRSRLKAQEELIRYLSPENALKFKKDELSRQRHILTQSIKRVFEANAAKLSLSVARLDALSPLKVLSRGFSIVYSQDGQHIKSTENLNENDKIRVQMNDGTAVCTVNEVIK